MAELLMRWLCTRLVGAGLIGVGVTAIITLCPGSVFADEGAPPPSSTIETLLTRPLLGVSGKELQVLTVQYVAGGASLPHRHRAQVFVYVLEGSVRMQVEGSAPVTLGPGETFYEGPKDIHTVSANASPTLPARILVFIVKNKGAPIALPP